MPEQSVLQGLKELVSARCPASLCEGILTLENGHTVDMVAVLQTVHELMDANMRLVQDFTTGACYDTKNPYRRESVVNALRVVGEMVGHGDAITAEKPIMNYLRPPKSEALSSEN